MKLVLFFSTTERMMVRTLLLILLGSLQLSSVIGEDYIINQEKPGWAVVRREDFSLVDIGHSELM